MNRTYKEIWIELFAKFKEMRLLWDPKDRNYNNQTMRKDAYEQLIELYKKYDDDISTVDQLKNKLSNFRARYIKERKKKLELFERGIDYVPTLWYYKYINFLTQTKNTNNEESTEDQELVRFSRYDNKLYLEVESPETRRSKRKRPNIKYSKDSMIQKTESENRTLESSKEEDKTKPKTTQRSPPSRPVNNLLRTRHLTEIRQTKLTNSASQIAKKPKEAKWEVVGKAIGQQLYNLTENQRVIANKLISDVIFNGNMGRLTTESFLSIDNYGDLSDSKDEEIKEHVEYLDESFFENE